MSVTWRAPGRVNLIGEHTDYNGGFALPFAIEQGCTAVVDATAPAGTLIVESAQRVDQVRFDLDALAPGVGGWAGYIAGVVHALQQQGMTIPAIRVSVDSDVPVGGGLSSSAALTCAAATAIDDHLGLDLGADEMLAITRSAENDFVGAPTGGMDQLAALRCTAGHALLCDMRTTATTDVALDPAAAELSILVIDSRAPHRHADGQYRLRRAACEEAARILDVQALCDITPAKLSDALARLPDRESRRYVRHVVTENARVLHAVELLRAGQLEDIGPLLTESHRSMRDDYRITVPELDVAVQTLLDAGALGARMTGGGFGGSVIALIATDQVTAGAAAVVTAYARRRFASPHWFTTRPGPGAHAITPGPGGGVHWPRG